MLVSAYTCAAIVTKPGNLIKLFVNELVAPARGSGDRQFYTICHDETYSITATNKVIKIYFEFITKVIKG
jgi:hypothetical protein